jgi:cell shape-determining protein MreC
VNLNNFIIISISLLFLLKLPRVMLFENFHYIYLPLIEVENFIYDIYNLRKEFESFVLLECKNEKISYGISFIPPIYPKEVLLNLGREDSVVIGDLLTVKNILLGKIVEVHKHSSLAITIFNENFSASVLIRRSNYLGIVEGGIPLRLSYIARGSDVKEGDTLITSSIDGVYPYGLIVGTVGKIIKREGVFETREVSLPYYFERPVVFNIYKK